MADIAMCSGTDCPIKDLCCRFTAPKSEVWQSYHPFHYDTGTNHCEDFWSNKPEEKPRMFKRARGQ